MSDPASIPYVLSITALRLIPSSAGPTYPILFVFNSATSTPDCAGMFKWEPASAVADDSWNVIRPTDSSGNGRWIFCGVNFAGSMGSGVGSSGLLGVGGTANVNSGADESIGIEAISQGGGNNGEMGCTGYTSNAVFHFRKADGTPASPTPPLVGENIGSTGYRTLADISGNTFAGSTIALEGVITQTGIGHVFPASYWQVETSATDTRNLAARFSQNRCLQVNTATEAAQFVVQADSGLQSLQLLGLGSGSQLQMRTAVSTKVMAQGQSAADSVLFIAKDSTSLRSVNAAGTINASGADYADYETKSEDCGELAKGQIVGYDAEGYLTDKFSHSIAFGVKSTDPSVVGGDTHLSNLIHGDRPYNYGEPAAPMRPHQGEILYTVKDSKNNRSVHYHDTFNISGQDYRPYDHEVELAEYHEAHTAWQKHIETLSEQQDEWDKKTEPHRLAVDRIAKAGRVPCVVTGKVFPAGYVVAQEGPEDTIIGVCLEDRPSRNVVGIVRTAYPDEARINRLIALNISRNPDWNSLIEVIQS